MILVSKNNKFKSINQIMSHFKWLFKVKNKLKKQKKSRKHLRNNQESKKERKSNHNIYSFINIIITDYRPSIHVGALLK
jgi:hypothetical protein